MIKSEGRGRRWSDFERKEIWVRGYNV